MGIKRMQTNVNGHIDRALGLGLKSSSCLRRVHCRPASSVGSIYDEGIIAS